MDQKVTLSLPAETLSHIDAYRTSYSLTTRGEVLALALKLLREQELAAGYRALAEEMAQPSDLFVDSGLGETLAMMDDANNEV